jgi:histidine ammonia-lyase
VFELKTILEKTIHLTADNKILSAPSNGDTMNIHNYEKDIFFTPYKVYEKFTKMMSNLYKVMQLEIETAILGLNNVY